MRKNILVFMIGVMVGMIGVGLLSASNSSGGGWTDRDVFKAIQLLEKIAENTAR